MRPFNLDEAIAGERVVTRNGSEVVQLAYFPTMPVMRQIVFAIANSQFLSECDIEGHYYPDKDRKSGHDLFMRGPSNPVGRPRKVHTALKQLAEEGDEI